MYARVTQFVCKLESLDDLVAQMDDVKAKVKKIPGVVDVYSVWGDDGHGVVMALYQDQAACDTAVPLVADVWSVMADFLAGPPEAKGYANVMHITG